MTNATIFSGIKPSGELHIGGYIGSVKQWLDIQKNPSILDVNITHSELIFSVVDLHAITVYQDPHVLRQRTMQLVALYLAFGVDPKLCKLFIQSTNSNHTYLAWILDCMCSMGQMERMTQYKDKKVTLNENISVGLFNYPALMAADILLYGTTHVPVGEDQKQHIELTRDLAMHFNKKYTETFIIPKPVIKTEGRRIMSLQNPNNKMSKSESDPLGTICILDTKDEMIKKIVRATTDSDSLITYEPENRKAVANLLEIFASFDTNLRTENEIATFYKEKGFKVFKEDLGELVSQELGKIQLKYNELISNMDYLDLVVKDGEEWTYERSSTMLSRVKKAIGIY